MQQEFEAEVPPAVSNWGWSRVYTSGDVPSIRHVHSAVTYANHMYVFGGYDGTWLNDLYSFCFDTREWSKVQATGAKPSGRHSHSAVTYQDSLYIWGGIGKKTQRFQQISRFQFATSQWSEVPVKSDTNPPACWGHTAVVFGSNMYVFGGFSTSATNHLWVFNFENQTWRKIEGKGKVPHPVQYHSAVVYQNSMYVMGGFLLTTEIPHLYHFSFDTEIWSLINSDGPKRKGHCCVVYSNAMYLCFGKTGSERKSDLWEYNFDSSQWYLVCGDIKNFATSRQNHSNNIHNSWNTAEIARQFHTAVVYGNRFYVFGGLTNHSKNDILSYSFERDKISSPLKSNLESFVNNELYSDISFLVQGEKFFAHKIILASGSEHFRAMFRSGMKESDSAVIVLNDTKPRAFLALLHFLYTKSLSPIVYSTTTSSLSKQPHKTKASDNSDQNTTTTTTTKTTTSDEDDELLIPLFILADRLMIWDLKEMCQMVLSGAITRQNVQSLTQLAEQYNGFSLRHSCRTFCQSLS